MTDTDDTDTFDIGSLFEDSARDWPYTGERNVVLNGVRVEASERFGNFYDDSDERVKFEEQGNYDKDNLPPGFSYAPIVQLVLGMVVEDKSLPEPDYPPTVNLGDTRGVEILEGGQAFRFLSKDGNPRLPQKNSTFFAFVNALVEFRGQVTAQFANLVDGDKVWHTAAFEGLPLVYGPTEVEVNNTKKTRAWPLGLQGGTTADIAPAGDVDDQLKAAAEAAEGDADAFRNVALQIKGLPNDTKLQIAKDPSKVLAAQGV